MRRRFNVTGSCDPNRHYMVRLDDRLLRIRERYVDDGNYFVINRGRQYGKTTTLKALREYLSKDYVVFLLDFQLMGTEDFKDEDRFSHSFVKSVLTSLNRIETGNKEGLMKTLQEFESGSRGCRLADLFEALSSMCENSPRPIVLMIDEVDSASNNQVFIDFLAQLRGYYLRREEMPAFHSVILAGVYSIKNLKLKLRPKAEHQYNSPWNIAADFDIDMSFSTKQIASMLDEYEADYHTGMDVHAVAEIIYEYTSGYPVLVSSICRHIDEKVARDDGFETAGKAWSRDGVEVAVSMLLKENPALFESMAKQLNIYKDLYTIIEDIIYRGKRIPFSPEEKSINLGVMFGFLKEENDRVVIANRIFEMVLLNMFMAKEAITSEVYERGGSDRINFIKNSMLDMELVLKKFVEYFHEIYGEKDANFIEKYGRKFFLLYLKPIINGAGNYYLEAQTRDERRTDVIIDYHGEQFIIEMKIWHGDEYNKRGEQQLTDYLDYFQQNKGYMLSFNFNKQKEIGVKTILLGNKTIVEAVV